MIQIIFVLLTGLALRLYGINWDQGFHLHPDERMLIMVADRIHFFNQLNPDFFNYGSLPIYILKGTSQLLDVTFRTQFSNYDGMLYLGRYLSIFFDLGTILLIYKTAGLLFKDKKISLFSSFFYAIAFFPIQNSHFFISDVFLTFFTTLLIYKLLKYISLPTRHGRAKLVIVLGIILAAMLATKFTAVIFYPIILAVLLITMKQWNNKIISVLIFNFSLLTFNFLFMPYAFLEYQRFLSDITAQIRMNSDPYIFPYTLQYVGTLPYLYYLKNIFLWGLGPVISALSIVGVIKIVTKFITDKVSIVSLLHYFTVNKNNDTMKQWINILIFFLFYFFHFLIIGRSAVKFMRYMLPIYPFLTIIAGYGLYQIQNMSFLRRQESRKFAWIPTFVGMTTAMIWTMMFINIYSQKHTRVAATEWILQNIPKGSTLALEHWDDGLPLRGGENYKFVEITLYDQPDDEKKWSILNEKLKTADYIVIASNRLYVPLQKLADCKKYRLCFPKTAKYYRKLFNDQLGFIKAAEFIVKPKLEVGGWKLEVDDQSADESFAVYDHPKIMIFKKI